MKVFNRDKYVFKGIYRSPIDGRLNYAFQSLTNDANYAADLVLVREAKLVYSKSYSTYFDENELITMEVMSYSKSPRVNRLFTYALSLAVNERKWSDRETDSKVIVNHTA